MKFIVIFWLFCGVCAAKDITLLEKKTDYIDIEVTVDKSIHAMRNARNYVLKQIKEPLENAKEAEKEKRESSVSANFRTVWASDNYLSLEGGYSFNAAGMAHPVSTEISHIFDLKNNRQVPLSDIIDIKGVNGAAKTLTDYIITDVARQKILKERDESNDTNKTVTKADIKGWVEGDSFLQKPTAKKMFKNFIFLTEDENYHQIKSPKRKPIKFIHFIYSHYDIAAYREGGYSVSVPVSVFKDKIKPEWRLFFAF